MPEKFGKAAGVVLATAGIGCIVAIMVTLTVKFIMLLL